MHLGLEPESSHRESAHCHTEALSGSLVEVHEQVPYSLVVPALALEAVQSVPRIWSAVVAEYAKAEALKVLVETRLAGRYMSDQGEHADGTAEHWIVTLCLAKKKNPLSFDPSAPISVPLALLAA